MTVRFALRLLGLFCLGLAACAPPAVASRQAPQVPAGALPIPPAAETSAPTAPAASPLPEPVRSARPPTAAPDPGPTPTAARTECPDQPGQIETASLRTPLLKLPMEVRIYLPPCYNQDSSRAYPVLLLIHGQSYTEDQWDRLGADEAADRLIAAGETPAFIIVMPRDRLWKDPTESNFGRAVVEVLIPWIDQTYRTLPERRYRAVGGLSRGAAWAVHLGLSHWELFGAIGAHSSPVFYSDAGQLRGWLAAIPPDSRPRIYLDIGEKDYLRESNQWLEGLLDELDIPHEYYLFPGYHEEAYWSAHVEQYLRWYAAGW